MSMKNITLSVDAEVLAAVRRYAADHNASVNAIVAISSPESRGVTIGRAKPEGASNS